MTNEQRDRLIKLLGILGSEHIGERAVAAKKIEELRVEINMEWAALVIVVGAPPPVAAAQSFGEEQGAIVDPKLPLHLLDTYSSRLSAWEKEFLQDLERKRCEGQSWSPKQRNKLFEIADAMKNPPKRKYQAFGGGGWR